MRSLTHSRRIPYKIVLTALLSLFSIALFLTDPRPPRLLCAVAMLLSSLGDLALMDESSFGDRAPISNFALGAGLFALAHAAYIAAYLLAAREQHAWGCNAGTAIGAAALLGALLLYLRLLAHGGTSRPRALLGLLYLLVLSLDCTVVLSYAAAARGAQWLCMAGALAFFLSDCLVGLKVYGHVPKGRQKALDTAIWRLYPLAQFLLVYFVL